MEFRVCYKDGGGWLIDKFTLKEDEALFHKKFLEAQGKQVQISVFDRLMEQDFDYDEYIKQKKESTENKQLTIHERWALDGLPNVVPPTEETLAYVAWFKEQEEKKKAKKTCQHKNVDTWFDEESGDNTITCQDCGAVFYHEDYLQRLIKDGK